MDIDLRRDGPHGLIAGTTGSGKSELLQSLVVGLAARIPHEGRMCLLERVTAWDSRQIHCEASSHRIEDATDQLGKGSGGEAARGW